MTLSASHKKFLDQLAAIIPDDVEVAEVSFQKFGEPDAVCIEIRQVTIIKSETVEDQQIADLGEGHLVMSVPKVVYQ